MLCVLFIVFRFHFVPEINGKGDVNVGCGPKNLSLDSSVGYSWGTTLDSTQSLSATALQFSSTGNSRFYKCNTDGCNGESPTKYYKTTIEGFFLLIVGIFGALGNILAMIVLTRPSMRSNVNLIFAGKSNSANTLGNKSSSFVKVCTKVQSSEITKKHCIFEDQKMEKLDISLCPDPQILKCRNQISFCLH